MPREDVPYPTSAICSIRERIAELRDELDQLLKTVNGVSGDANHEIKLISDNAALGITNDAAQHEIHLDLDASQLPAALVDSVNGQIGAVVLDGDDLDGVTPGNSVNDDIAALQGADVTLQGNINAEATARANADSALQTNINAALATIPGEVSSQITNNADIIQLQNDVLAIPNKVDKRTGAGKFAYTHDGSTQGDIALVDGTTGATIPIRDANGRMQAADPASGATDKTLVTANWASQTGDSSPNNLVHRSGAETIIGDKTYLNFITGTSQVVTIDTSGGGVANKYQVIMKLDKTVNYGLRQHFLVGAVTRQRNRPMDLFNIYINTNSALGIQMVLRNNTAENYTYVLSQDSDYIYVTIVTDGTPHDSIQCIIIASTQKYTDIPTKITTYESYNSVPGTEIGRLTP